MSADIDNTPVSIVILTYNRPEILSALLRDIEPIAEELCDVIVVDNNSDASVFEFTRAFDFVQLIELPENIGVGGRNHGIMAASGEIVITLDDDVGGITREEIHEIRKILNQNDIAGVCFKVIDAETSEVIDWGHHRKKEEFCNTTFITDDISEGAVAFRRDIVIKAGLYPEEYFISHEGPDLALRIMNLGYKILYSPEITVLHSHSALGRTSWRRYYYDTRNLIWLIVRNYPFFMGLKALFLGLAAMAVYSLRDRYFLYWVKGIFDAVRNIRWAIDTRITMSEHTRDIFREIDKYRPGLFYMIRTRIFKGKFGI